MNDKIRQACENDASRLAEIEVFNYRLNFYPIFRNDSFYFGDLQVSDKINEYLKAPEKLKNTYVYDDGVVKGFVTVENSEVKKLFVDKKLSQREKSAIPLFCDGGGIFWIPGFAVRDGMEKETDGKALTIRVYKKNE